VRRHFGEIFDEHIPEALQVFSFRSGLAKPDPRLFMRVLEAARVDPAGAVMIGDSYDKDIAPAAELGMGTVRVTAGAAARA
jgi:putative hydrolase of the HAD superfamily